MFHVEQSRSALKRDLGKRLQIGKAFQRLFCLYGDHTPIK